MKYIYLTEKHLVVEEESVIGVTGLDLFTLVQGVIEEFRKEHFIEHNSTSIVFSEKIFKELECVAFKHYGKYDATQIYGVVFKVEESPKYPIQIKSDF